MNGFEMLSPTHPEAAQHSMVLEELLPLTDVLKYALARELNIEITSAVPVPPETLTHDLLIDAFSKVNWVEIAARILVVAKQGKRNQL